MSRVQEALSRKDHDCAEPAVPVAEPFEADNQERSDKSCQHGGLGEYEYRQLRRGSILQIVRKSSTGSDRSAAQRTSRLKSPKSARASVLGTCKGSEIGRISAPRHESESARPLQEQSESVAAQIRRFQERADLRECLLPGMLGRISRKACEGWQRQASVRNSRMLAKIKLASCKGCPYASKPDPASV